ncbi:MAG: nucleotidyltransferase family protein [Oscillospiraceae bacterium]|nr:nucleotidyltransferase family protein [Oscillospiraceae bacterium]
MTREEYRNAVGELAWLIACELNGQPPEKERARALDLTRLFEAAQRHSLCAITAAALERAGVRDEAFTRAKGLAIRKRVLMDRERAAVLAGLEEAGIWYVPLKGQVLSDWYPAFWQREMTDFDILYDASRDGEMKAVMERCGFTAKRFGRGHQDVFFKEPVCNFEMHRCLFSTAHDEKFYTYYRDVKTRLLKDEGNACGYHFSPEDLYVYQTAHAAKHYSNGGIGLRALLDVFVMERHFAGTLDRAYIREQTEKLGITDYEENSRALALRLFSGEALSGEDEERLAYMMLSGTHGRLDNRVDNRVGRLGGGAAGRLRYLTRRLFLSRGEVEAAYPFFARHPLLRPLLFFRRLWRALTVRRRKVAQELKALRRSADE